MEASAQLEVNKPRRDVMIKLSLKRLASGNRWSSCCEAAVTIVAPANYLVDLEMTIMRLAKSKYQIQFNKTVIAHLQLLLVYSYTIVHYISSF